MQTKTQPKAKKYIYSIKSSHECTEGLTISFRADTRGEADKYAKEEVRLVFGAKAKAKFLKEI